MTHINYRNITAAASRIWHDERKRRIVIASLTAGLLLTIGCSRETNKPAGSAVLSPSASTVSNPTMAAPAVAPASATASMPQKPAVKKAARKHSSMVTFKDDTYGISFGYPRKYILKTGEDLKSDSDMVTMNFLQPGGLPAVSVELPEHAYPGTDLTSAFFRVNVHKELAEAACTQFAAPEAKPDNQNPVRPSQVRLGDLTFQQVENITSASTEQVDTKYYHVFENGTCYEFALGLTTAWDGNEDGVNLVDREDVFRRLEKILAGVKIAPEAAPAVASDAKITPPAEPVISK